MISRKLILLVLIALGSQLYSQNYIFNRISIGDGLLSNNIRSIWQDSSGYIWIGSENGLQRYDGIRLRTILRKRVDQIISDNKNRVWIRTGNQIGLFNPTSFTINNITYEQNSKLISPNKLWLKKDASGGIYLLLTGIEVQYFNPKTLNFSAQYSPYKTILGTPVLEIVDDPGKQRIWTITKNGLGYWDRSSKRHFTNFHNQQNDSLLAKLGNTVVSGLFIDNNHHYWIKTNKRSAPYYLTYDSRKNGFTKEAEHLNHDFEKNHFEIYGLKKLSDSVSAIYGLNYFRIQNGKTSTEIKSTPNNPYGIQFNAITDIIQDQEGIIWVATDNGVFYTSNVLTNTHIVFSLEKNRRSISSLMEDKYQNLWIATWGGGVYVVDKNGDLMTNHLNNNKGQKQPIHPFVWTLCQDNFNNIWIGCQGGNLYRFNQQNKKLLLFRVPAFHKSDIRQIIHDQNGRLWFGLLDGRVFYLHPSNQQGTQPNFTLAQSFDGIISKMTIVNDQQIWIAVSGMGIVILDINTGKIISTLDYIKTKQAAIANIRDILPVNDTLCIIAGERLGTVNPRNLSIDFSLVNNNNYSLTNMYTMQMDGFNNLWLGSSNGIFKLNLKSKILSKYTQQDGLLTIHNNSYVPERSVKLHSGNFAFGGNQHLVIYNPDLYNSSIQPPDVSITGFQLGNQYLPLDSLERMKEIIIPYDQGNFSIELAALSYRQKNKITYEYKLEGLDDKWIVVTDLLPVKYNYLPPGEYKFMVRARNEAGQYSSKNTSLVLSITPPFWKSTWFYFLIILSLTGILFFIHRLRLQRLLHVEKVRSRLARDLHDDMGSTLSTINILSNLALQQDKLDESKAKDYMSTISVSTSQMMEAMDDIVWSINPMNDSLSKILSRMKETAGAILEPKQIEYRFDVAENINEIKLPMESRREIFLIFKEAINNIVKYAECTEVIFSLHKKVNKFSLSICDNGKGFNTSTDKPSTGRNGLKNMNKRASNLKGKLFIQSQPGMGTTVTLWVPIA
ncbi:MAG TPA: two-component regulator propeller domain-containing protein [Niabella sp.]|nr:two-component regulator propeller domain-containing protein [Niabella sp.]HQW13909.1 two-component regulator propeller domain-containing protein [Niabella sp.]HQX19198.1 two-component regulator propeller domain-containing protein [Niabella sp.]HRB06248.1 two-component regulator propeller domain-containing protein [Niabella sp.]HRB26950.1 two-component regulator propeller domain-containing protein [Niabella sp.]